MKTKIATALSLVGVLGAGSAAALVNTQILDGGTGSADASGVLSGTLPSTSSTSIAASSTSTTDATTTTVVTSTTMPDTTVVATTPAVGAAPSGMLTTFNVGDAGTVTVDVRDGRPVFIGAEAASGWTLVETEDDDGDDEVEVKFANATTLVEFTVVFRDGALVPSVESEAIGGSGGSGGSGSTATTTSTTVAGGGGVTTTTIDHDDDDDDDDDDEYEDDDHDDDGDDEHEDDDDHDDD